jgi:hypothetical protein
MRAVVAPLSRDSEDLFFIRSSFSYDPLSSPLRQTAWMELNIPHVLDLSYFCAAPAKSPDCIMPEVAKVLSDRKINHQRKQNR